MMRSALAIALALASGTAAALGLGQIEVKSKLGQPLLAEIPIVSSDPSELEQLQAGLASPDTFARIGLQPPVGIVADLQFTAALDAAGRPVIRVTTVQPVNEPLLTFLVEVDWGQGRLVREYSALVDAPRTVSAPVQPMVQAPVIQAPDLIERPLEPVAAAEAPATPAAEPAPRDDAIAIAPAQPDAGMTAGAVASSGEYTVKRGDTLARIAGGFDTGTGYSLEQAMIALLRANPDAFIGGNINLLRQGAVLRMPAQSELANIEMQRAMEVVQGQMQQWRQARQATVQPASPVQASTRTADATAATSPRTAGARLEIVPPGASRAKQAGTQSGINAGGEGTMLRQELQQTKESLAAREAELQDLKSRIAELEKLQNDQQQLIALKDTELAAAQQTLAKAQAAPTAATTTASTAPTPAQPAPTSPLPWVFGGLGVLLALLGGWALRRRGAAAPRFRPPTAPRSSLAEAFPSSLGATPLDPTDPSAVAVVDAADAAPGYAAADDLGAADLSPAGRSGTRRPAALRDQTPADPVLVVSPVPSTADASTEPPTGRTAGFTTAGFATGDFAADDITAGDFTAAGATAPADADADADAPFWDRRDRQKLPTRRPPAPAPSWETGSAAAGTAGTAAAEAGSGNERLELARAYIDLGDRDSARQLLGEVVVNGDHSARQQATRMLRELE